jgi:FkbM family methyltransferase
VPELPPTGAPPRITRAPRGRGGLLSAIPRIGRTRFLRLATRLGHDRLLALDRLRKRNPLVGAVSAPLRWWLRRGSVRVTGGMADGLRLSMAHFSLAHAHAGVLPRGSLEASVQEALKRVLGKGDVLYDIGANLGFFALVGARLVGPEGHVYAFEPAPRNAAAIRENASLNGLSEVVTIERAVGSAAGRDRLLLVEDLSWSRLESRGWHPATEETIEVDVVAIDDLVRAGEIPPPDVVKVDVEGSEIDVLRGMRETLSEHRPAVVCELHGTNAAFVEAMEELGYVIDNLEGKEPVLEAPPNVHALAVPR